MEFIVEKKIIACDVKEIVGDNDYEAIFVLDDEWDGKAVQVKVVWNNRASEDIDIVDDKCTIPAHMLKKGNVSIGVFADGLASSRVNITVRESIKQDTYAIAVPHKEAWEEIKERVADVVTNSEFGSKVNDYLTESDVLKTSKRYLNANNATYTKNKHVNGTTGAYAGSGAFGVYSFDISGLYDSGVRGISTFIQTYSNKDGNNEGYAFFDADGAYIGGGVATVFKSIEDVLITVPEGATKFEISVTFDALYGLEYREFNGIALASEVDMQNKKAIADLEVSASQSYSDICLGTVYAVVGDTIQLFYKSFIDCDLDNMIVKFGCAKGKNYPRYWEFTPVASDVGEHTITIEIYNKSGNLVNSASTTLVVAEASNPASAVNVLCIGDSTMSSGQIPIEASRRLKGTVGVATTPTALALNNINFVGRLQNATADVGWEGTGGWSYGTYNAQGVKAVRFTVSDATNINMGDAYDVGNFCFSITEINVNDGVGNIRCIFSHRTPYSSAFDSTSASGTMTRYSGNGQESITYTAWELENYQPFWNNDTDAFDITSYKDMYCGGAIDVICVLLQINSLIGANPFSAMTGNINSVKTFCNNIHAQLPDCKIMLSTLPLVSPNGGIAANYGSSGTSGEYNATGFNHKVRAFNKALIELGADESYKDYVTIVNSHAQFDIDNGYPITTKAVNTRVSTTETLQSNAVHPNNYGYWQIADALGFRALLNILS